MEIFPAAECCHGGALSHKTAARTQIQRVAMQSAPPPI